MIELFASDTPNGKKISIMLEEIKLPYKVISIDDFDFKVFQDTLEYLNLHKGFSKIEFDILRNSRPGKLKKRKFEGWGKQEEDEFQHQISKFKGFKVG